MTKVSKMQHTELRTKCLGDILGSRMLSIGVKDQVFYPQIEAG